MLHKHKGLHFKLKMVLHKHTFNIFLPARTLSFVCLFVSFVKEASRAMHFNIFFVIFVGGAVHLPLACEFITLWLELCVCCSGVRLGDGLGQD